MKTAKIKMDRSQPFYQTFVELNE